MAIDNLTYGLIKKRLQIANSCASFEGVELIDLKRKGLNCDKEIHAIDLKLALIDSIRNYACITEQRRAYHIFDLTGHAPFNSISITTSFGGVHLVTWQGTLTKTLSWLDSFFNFADEQVSVDNNSLIVYAPIVLGYSGNAETWELDIVTGIVHETTNGAFSCGITGNHTQAEYAKCIYSTAQWGIGGGTPFVLTATFNFSIGGVSVFNSAPSNTVQQACDSIVTQINYAQDSEIAFYDETQRNFTITSPDIGEAGNAYTITWTTDTPLSPTITPSSHVFIGGVDEVDQVFDDSDTCLSTTQIENILEKLNILCDKPCTDLLNFKTN